MSTRTSIEKTPDGCPSFTQTLTWEVVGSEFYWCWFRLWSTFGNSGLVGRFGVFVSLVIIKVDDSKTQ